MAFGYKVPNFNMWGRTWTAIAVSPNYEDGVIWDFRGYFKCQVRGGHGGAGIILEVPKWSNFHASDQRPFGMGDLVQVGGWEIMWAQVYGVSDIGAGFPNEHRSLLVFPPVDISWDSVWGAYPPSSNKDLMPPDGALMLGTTPPADFWADPDFSVIQP